MKTNCYECGKEIDIYPQHYKINEKRFCSKECYWKFKSQIEDDEK